MTALDPATFRPAGSAVLPVESAALRSAGYKWCAPCQTAKPLEDFYVSPSRHDGRAPKCRECSRAAARVQRDAVEISDPSSFLPAGVRIRPDEVAALEALDHKWCNGCRTAKPLEDFAQDAARRDGKTSWCRACGVAHGRKSQARWKARWTEVDPFSARTSDHKRCPRCSRDLPVLDFSLTRTTTDGLSPWCRECSTEEGKARRERYRTRWTQEDPYLNTSAKRCGYCRQHRPREDFSTMPTAADGLRNRCRSCANALQAARQARKFGQWVEHVDRSVLWERDGGVCYLCGLLADPARWDVEHVHPISAGGEHSYANTAVSHPSCNYSKGAREWPSVSWDPFSPFADPAPTYPRGVLLVFLPDGSVRRGSETISAAEVAAVEAAPVVADVDEDQDADAVA